MGSLLTARTLSVLVLSILLAPGAAAGAVSTSGATPSIESAPSNDARMDAFVVAAASSTNGTNVDATNESGEPLPCGQMDKTVWYRFVANGTGNVSIDTLGSGFDTVLAAYRSGDSTPLACNYDDSNLSSHIVVSVVAGDFYDVQVGGYRGATGNFTLTLVPAPPADPADLVVTSVGVTRPGQSGSNATLWGIVQNLGGTAGEGFTVALEIDGNPVSQRAYPPGMPAGYVLNVSSNATLPGPGLHTLTVRADTGNAIPESNESNNALMIVFEGGSSANATADLTPTALSVDGSPMAGQSSNLRATVRNEGAAPAGNFTVAFRINGTTVATRNVSSLNANASVDLVANVTIPGAGVLVLSVVADAFGQVNESNETNNMRNLTFFAQPPPRPATSVYIVQLRPVTLRTEWGDVRHPLGRHDAWLQICNWGSRTATNGSTYLTVRGGTPSAPGVGATPLPTRSIASIPPGWCVSDRFTFDTPGVVGDFTLNAQIVVPDDSTAYDNFANATSFRVVADQGGVVAPNGAMYATSANETSPSNLTADVIEGIPVDVGAVNDAMGDSYRTFLQALGETVAANVTSDIVEATHGSLCGDANATQCRLLSGRPIIGGQLSVCESIYPDTLVHAALRSAAQTVDNATFSVTGRKVVCDSAYANVVRPAAGIVDERLATVGRSVSAPGWPGDLLLP